MDVVLKLAATSSLAIGLMLLNPVTASASLIYDASILLSAQGFGTAPRDLTVQRTGGTTSPESGCVSYSGGMVAVGSASCMGSDAAFMGNQKYGAPLESDRGITSAADIGILFNATEPGGDAINVTDLTLKFYLGDTLIGSIDGSQNFADSNPGNGVAGFVFTVDAAQTGYVNGLLSQGDIRLALESTLTGSSGGPESFRIVNLNGVEVDPRANVPDAGSSLLMLGAALGALGAVRRRFGKS
jgi:hypothetical protein